jgi:tRNA threonylcarbamoyladenosine biosynthesis protein TsaB
MLDSRRMRVLAVDTSTLAGGVALVDGERLVAEYLLDISVTHSERLLAAIDTVIADAGWTPRDVEGLAVAVGPGSFTGLRVGISTVKGLALALDVPVAAVPTLDAMAAVVPWAALPVCPVLHARRDEVYAALYRWNGEGFARQSDYMALAPDALAARLVEPTLLVGAGADAIQSPHARRLPAPRRVPSPACVAILGRARLALRETVSAAALTPFYLRPSEAELRRRVSADR